MLFPPLRALTPLGKLVGAFVVAVVVIGALWTAYRLLTGSARTEARLARNQTEAASQSGSDAVNAVAGAGDREHELDKGTEDAGRKIDAATDAAGADAAGSERLCKLNPSLCR